MSTPAVTVKLYGDTIGYLGYSSKQSSVASFQYDSEFVKNGVEISPIHLPLSNEPYLFDAISQRTFHGLPGFIADSLPDKFGNQLIDQYFAAKGIDASEITALDRLLYIGNRSMGALSYEPHDEFSDSADAALDLHSLFELSEMVLQKKEKFARDVANADQKKALKLFRVGSSAGGARSKALVAIDEDNKLYDGTMEHPFKCTYQLLKFDSGNNSDKDGYDPKGMTRVEYIYSLFAKACGIDIPKTSYIEDGEHFHYLIERFDRVAMSDGSLLRIHYVSWCGMAHADRDVTGAYNYEQLVVTARKIGVDEADIKEIFKRAVFNIVGRNQDDHTKNFGFLLTGENSFSLSPSFDMTYSFDPAGKWTQMHQIKLNGKQDHFTKEDIVTFGKFCNLSRSNSLKILDDTIEAFSCFLDFANKYQVSESLTKTIVSNIRTENW